MHACICLVHVYYQPLECWRRQHCHEEGGGRNESRNGFAKLGGQCSANTVPSHFHSTESAGPYFVTATYCCDLNVFPSLLQRKARSCPKEELGEPRFYKRDLLVVLKEKNELKENVVHLTDELNAARAWVLINIKLRRNNLACVQVSTLILVPLPSELKEIKTCKLSYRGRSNSRIQDMWTLHNHYQ